jgi:hypothetical protein
MIIRNLNEMKKSDDLLTKSDGEIKTNTLGVK